MNYVQNLFWCRTHDSIVPNDPIALSPEGVARYLAQNAVKTGVDSILNATVGGVPMDEAIKCGVKNLFVNAAGAMGAQAVGDQFAGATGLNAGVKIGLHAGVGAGMGAAMGGDPIAGGLGAAVAEGLAEALPGDMDIKLRAEIGKIGAGLAAILTGQDPNIAIHTATNAVENNFMVHATHKVVNFMAEQNPEWETIVALKKAMDESPVVITMETIPDGVAFGPLGILADAVIRNPDEARYVWNVANTEIPVLIPNPIFN